MNAPQPIRTTVVQSYLLKHVTLWRSTEVMRDVDIFVQDGRVVEILRTSSKKFGDDVFVMDGKGFAVLPAGVDAQVHLRVPGQPQKETAESGLWAAVHGGVGALLTMPNTKPVIDEPSVCELARSEVAPWEDKTGVKVLLSAAITKGQRGKELVDFDALAKSGVAAFTDDGVGVADDDVMLKALQGVAKVNLPILQHAEVPGHGGVLADGPVQRLLGGIAYPSSAETDMVARDIRLLAKAPRARYHVLHVSSAQTLEQVQKARDAGLHVTCEASPHHLYFSASEIKNHMTSFKMNPPLRSDEDRTALQAALADNRCQFMATDHAPHEPDVKTDNFKTSAFGTTGLETSLRVLLWMRNKGLLTPERLVEVWATAPAAFLGIADAFGDIAVGRPMHAVLVDVDASETVVAEEDFRGHSKNSCFIGSKLPGSIKATLLGKNVHQMSDL